MRIIRDQQPRDGPLGREPVRVELEQAYTLVCVQGLVWLTVESSDPRVAERDIVLACGEAFRGDDATVAFVSALAGPARIALRRYGAEPANAAGPDDWNAGSTEAASSSSMSA